MEIALITGASSGIGWETAKILAAKGYKVYGTSRNIAACPDMVGKARTDFGDRIEFLEMDVTRPASVKQCVDAAAIIGEREVYQEILWDRF